jgi:hypothetical protein
MGAAPPGVISILSLGFMPLQPSDGLASRHTFVCFHDIVANLIDQSPLCCIFTQVLIPTTFVCIALMPNTSLSPRWARLQKVEEIETDQYFIDVYVCPVTTEELREKYLNEPPVLYAFAVFDKQNTYLLSYALEMREAIRILPDETEETYIGYFLEAFCEHQHFTCKNFKEIEPDLETVRTTVISFVVEYNAVEKMLEYDREVSQNQSKVNDNPS